MHLPTDANQMLMGMVTRLVSQKGLDLLLESSAQWLELPVQLVLLGSGDDYYRQAFQQLADQHPDKVALFYGYDEGLAHRVEAGSDLYLMPSLFEPSGLNQLYSLRYGTLPLVSPVGGLVDTVSGVNSETPNGFVMENVSAQALMQSLQQALQCFANTPPWKQMQLTAMSTEYTWKKSAVGYLDMYQKAILANSAA